MRGAADELARLLDADPGTVIADADTLDDIAAVVGDAGDALKRLAPDTGMRGEAGDAAAERLSALGSHLIAWGHGIEDVAGALSRGAEQVSRAWTAYDGLPRGELTARERQEYIDNGAGPGLSSIEAALAAERDRASARELERLGGVLGIVAEEVRTAADAWDDAPEGPGGGQAPGTTPWVPWTPRKATPGEGQVPPVPDGPGGPAPTPSPAPPRPTPPSPAVPPVPGPGAGPAPAPAPQPVPGPAPSPAPLPAPAPVPPVPVPGTEDPAPQPGPGDGERVLVGTAPVDPGALELQHGIERALAEREEVRARIAEQEWRVAVEQDPRRRADLEAELANLREELWSWDALVREAQGDVDVPRPDPAEPPRDQHTGLPAGERFRSALEHGPAGRPGGARGLG